MFAIYFLVVKCYTVQCIVYETLIVMFSSLHRKKRCSKCHFNLHTTAIGTHNLKNHKSKADHKVCDVAASKLHKLPFDEDSVIKRVERISASCQHRHRIAACEDL